MQKCKICGCTIDENEEKFTVNAGMESEFHVCWSCLSNALDSGRIISCDECLEYFSTDILHDEVICGESFTACPKCGKDIVNGMSREQYAEEYGEKQAGGEF